MPTPVSDGPSVRLSIAEIEADFERIGIVGEKNVALGVYIVGTSRLLPMGKTLSAIVHGESSSGKSFIVRRVAELFPPDCLYRANKITPAALYNERCSLAHKFVVAGERTRVQDDAAADATSALRQLQSDGEITSHVSEERAGSGWVAVERKVVGPIAFVETTTLDPKKIFKEDANRAIILTTDNDEEHTRAIMQRRADNLCNGYQEDYSAIVKKHHEFQSSLTYKEVQIPFALEIANRLPATKIESRRVIGQILGVIQVVTILQQHSRGVSKEGKLVATGEDYAVAACVLKDSLGEKLSVGENTIACYKAILRKFGTDIVFTPSQIKKEFFDAYEEQTVRLWLNELKSVGSVEQVSEHRGSRPATWRATSQPPGVYGLPSMDAIIG